MIWRALFGVRRQLTESMRSVSASATRTGPIGTPIIWCARRPGRTCLNEQEMRVSTSRLGGHFDDCVILGILSCSAKGASHETPNCLSHRAGRWHLYLLQGSGTERRTHHSFAAWPSVILANVSAAFDEARRPLPSGRARLSGLRAQRLARPETV